MPELGTVTLFLALAASVWAAGSGVVAHRRGSMPVLRSAEGGLRAAFLALSVGSGILVALFLGRDFSVAYVAQYSDSSLPPALTVAAFWAGQEGSLLLWAWALAGVAVLAAAVHRESHRELVPVAVVVLAATLVFFTGLVAVASNPFTRLDFVPSDGAGLNPMLRHWAQIYHPPATFLGYVGFTVPFAFAVAALVTGRLDSEWVRAVRLWMIAAWLLLGLGIGLGARWAYTELGWGGYWAWDPVENVSLLPWLLATAYLHTAVLQERRGQLRVWNLVAAIAAFALTLFATFLVRSGVAASVHAFAESPAAIYFLGAILAIVVVGAGLIIWRLPQLHDRRPAVAGFTRESLLLLTNFLLAVYALAIFVGTLFPVLASALRGSAVSVGGLFFDRVSIPVAVALLVLLGSGPLVAWRHGSGRQIRRRLPAPAAVAVAIGTAAAIIDGGRNPLTVAVLALSAFALTALGVELVHGLGRGRRTGPAGRRRHGAAIAHVGVVLLVIGLALDGTYRADERHELAVGESTTFGSYVFTLESLDTEEGPTRSAVSATLVAHRAGAPVARLVTERYIAAGMDQPRTEVGVRTLLREDLYVILDEVDLEAGTARLHLNRHPGVLWIWLGGGLALLGGLVAGWPAGNRLRTSATSSRPVEARHDEPSAVEREPLASSVSEQGVS